MTSISRPSHRYRMSGLTVASELLLPGSIPVADRSAPCEVVLRAGTVLPDLGGFRHRGPGWFADDRRFLLDLPEIGRFLATDGREILMEPADGMPVEDALPFATGTAFAALLYQRGALLLHGSAVVVEGRAFVLCGPTGAGKSTLAAALCQAGCGFAADDICAISLDSDGTPLLHPDGRRLRLFRDSIQQTGLEHAVGPQVRRQVPKYYVTPPAGAGESGDPVPLAAVYVLREANPASRPGLEALPPLIAAQALLRQCYRRRLALAYGGHGRLAERIAGILSRAGVYQLRRPRDLASLQETVSTLHAHWSRLSR